MEKCPYQEIAKGKGSHMRDTETPINVVGFDYLTKGGIHASLRCNSTRHCDSYINLIYYTLWRKRTVDINKLKAAMCRIEVIKCDSHLMQMVCYLK